MGMKHTRENTAQDAFKRNGELSWLLSFNCSLLSLIILSAMESVVSGGAQTPPSGGISTTQAHGIMNPMDNTQILWMGKTDKISQSYEKRVGWWSWRKNVLNTSLKGRVGRGNIRFCYVWGNLSGENYTASWASSPWSSLATSECLLLYFHDSLGTVILPMAPSLLGISNVRTKLGLPLTIEPPHHPHPHSTQKFLDLANKYTGCPIKLQFHSKKILV